MNVEEILKHKVFKQIDEAVSVGQYNKAYGLMSMETPIEWTTLGTSDISGQQYRYLPIDVLEALMDRIFGYCGWNDESETFITQTNSSATVTTTVNVIYGFVSIKRSKSGVASVYVEDNFHWKDGKMILHTNSKPIKAMQQLTTVTPLSLTEAKKNAIKNIANLFGRNLNRNIIEALPVIQVEEKEKAEPDIIILKKYSNACEQGDEQTKKEIEDNYKIL